MSINSEEIKVDILLASYNGERYIREQLDSLLAQSHKNINIIIHDDGSTDSTVSIIREYEKKYPVKVKLLDDGKHFGNASDNFMYLTGYGSADYIMFCDQDDYWDKDKVRITLDNMLLLESKGGKDRPYLVFSAYMATDSDLKPLKNGMSFLYKLDLNHILVQNCIAGCMCMINRKLKELAGEPDEAIIMHDWWLALIASSMGDIYYIDTPLMLYRQHGNNVVGRNNLTSLKSRVKKFKNPYTKKLMFVYERQARLLYNRLGGRMPDEKKKILKSFLDIYDAPKMKRPSLLRKGNYLKSDFVRAAGQQWYLMRYDKDILND